jgi:hypothetical protein
MPVQFPVKPGLVQRTVDALELTAPLTLPLPVHAPPPVDVALKVKMLVKLA